MYREETTSTATRILFWKKKRKKETLVIAIEKARAHVGKYSLKSLIEIFSCLKALSIVYTFAIYEESLAQDIYFATNIKMAKETRI